jgi:hypothetical protein
VRDDHQRSNTADGSSPLPHLVVGQIAQHGVGNVLVLQGRAMAGDAQARLIFGGEKLAANGFKMGQLLGSVKGSRERRTRDRGLVSHDV